MHLSFPACSLSAVLRENINDLVHDAVSIVLIHVLSSFLVWVWRLGKPAGKFGQRQKLLAVLKIAVLDAEAADARPPCNVRNRNQLLVWKRFHQQRKVFTVTFFFTHLPYVLLSR